MPSFNSEHTRSTCWRLVSGFLTEMTQQIHSLRASGVISSHFARAIASDVSAFRKSAGTLCTAPGEMVLFGIDCILSHRHWAVPKRCPFG